VADLDGESVATTVDDITADGGVARGYVLDVSDEVAVPRTIAGIVSDLGSPSALVTLAGGSLDTPRDLPDISAADFDVVLGVNLRGTFLCCQAVVPFMIEAGRGAIVTVSSIGGRSTTPVTGVPYAAAKAGVLGLTRRLAREVGPYGIRVNAVAPGLFLSGPRLQGMWDGLSVEEKREVLDAIPLTRMPDLHEVADPIIFLISDASSYVTGAVLDVNGGRFMGG
jgi:3-oxoacyl-[acyl-carrier protein] reductase